MMTQPGPHRIAKALKIIHLPPPLKRFPTNHGALEKDDGGEAAHYEYSYPSGIGMIGYLQGTAGATAPSPPANGPTSYTGTSDPTMKPWSGLVNTSRPHGDKGLILHPKTH
jgi:hypothetical protein